MPHSAKREDRFCANSTCVYRLSAVDDHLRPGYVREIVRSKCQRKRCDLFRCGHPLQSGHVGLGPQTSCSFPRWVGYIFHAVCSSHQRGIGGPRNQGVDANVFCRIVQRGRLDKADQSAFAGSVCRPLLYGST